jgi:hypothetical protein
MKHVAPVLLGGFAVAAAMLVSATVVFAAGLYDGTYHGTLIADGANATNCAKQAPIQMTVTDSKLEYNHMGAATITATVGADGSFSGSGQNKFSAARVGPLVTNIVGTIAAGAIQADANTGNYCKYKLQLKKF